MIDLYSSISPNVQKIYLMLEEIGLPYTAHEVDVYRGDQYSSEFHRLNPNRKVPVIVDQEGPGGRPYTVFESGAILMYLAEKTGQLMPKETAEKYNVIQWLMIQLTGIGPMFGQFNHFQRFAPQLEYPVERYTSQTRRLYDLIEHRLGGSRFLGGNDYSIVDIATFPWIRVEAKYFAEKHPVLRIDWHGHPNITRWFRTIEARPAVARALAIIDAMAVTWKSAPKEDIDRYLNRSSFAETLQG